MSRRDIALALVVIVIWGCNFVTIRLGMVGIPPLLFAAIRFLVLMLALPFVKRPDVGFRDLMVVGLLMSAGQFGFVYSGIAAGVTSGLAALVLQAQAPMTAVVAAAVLGEKPRWVQVLGLLIATAGLAIVALGRGEATPLAGLLLVLGGALSWAAGNVASRRLGRVSGLGITVWSGLAVPLPLLVLSLLLEGPAAIATGLGHFGVPALLSTLYTVVFGSLVGFGVWTTLLSKYPASTVAPFSMLVPVVGFLAGWAVLGERPSASALLGGAVLLAGVALVVVGPRLVARREARPASGD